jgi:hypothetical protein
MAVRLVFTLRKINTLQMMRIVFKGAQLADRLPHSTRKTTAHSPIRRTGGMV